MICNSVFTDSIFLQPARRHPLHRQTIFYKVAQNAASR